MDHELISLHLLTHVQGLGPKKVRRLIKQFGSAAEVVAAGLDKNNLLLFEKWKLDPSYKEDLEQVESEGVALISYQSYEYPERLLELSDAPLVLYVKGQLKGDDHEAIAVVGSRMASEVGLSQAHHFASTLAHEGKTIVSGLAKGIDGAAHRGALVNGRTVAFLGSGFNHVYPKENERLSEQICERGALVTEFPMNMKPLPGNFPKRNRLICGMSEGLVVIEASRGGGSVLALGLAKKQHKPCFVLSLPNNEFLYEMAQVVEKSEDVLDYFYLHQNQ